MNKSELVYLLLVEKLAETQLEASEKLGISLSTVNYAIAPLRKMGAVQVNRNGIKILDKRKLLLYWASMHKQEILYSTNVESIRKAEMEVPPEILFTSFTAFRRLLNKIPSDYSEAYAYAPISSLQELKKRFPSSSKKHNFFVLKAPERLFEFGKNGCVPLSLVFVDLWNNKEWYASEFVNGFGEVLNGRVLG